MEYLATKEALQMAHSFSFYDLIMNPLEKRILRKARKHLISRSHGVVLEIGAGTGANLPHYHYKTIDRLDILDATLQHQVMDYGFPEDLPVRFIEGEAESLPFSDELYDFVIITLVLCSVTDLDASLQEVYRVMKPGGSFIFIEHVLPHHPFLKKVFHTMTPLWKKMAHNCHLNRETLKSIRTAGFTTINPYPVHKDIFVGGVAKKPPVASKPMNGPA